MIIDAVKSKYKVNETQRTANDNDKEAIQSHAKLKWTDSAEWRGSDGENEQKEDNRMYAAHC